MVDQPCLIRTALLSVAESVELIAADHLDDQLVAAAIALAADAELLASAPTKERARHAVRRYIARMGGRATPYGLFAGTTFGTVDKTRALRLDPRSAHRVHVRVDTKALELAVAEAMDEADFDQLPLRPNPTIARRDGELRYVRPGDESADVVSMRATAAIEAVLAASREGAASGAELLAALSAASPGSPPAALRAFLTRLLDGDLLLRAGDIVAPGREPSELALRLLDGERAAVLRTLLDEIGTERVLDVDLPESLQKAWKPAAQRISAWTELPEKERFHLDLELSMSDPTVDARTVRELTDTLRRLELAFPPYDPLRDFREAFARRYEDAEVPLLEALDPERGVRKVRARELSNLAHEAGAVGASGKSDPTVPNTLLRVLDKWQRTGLDVDISDFPLAERTSAQSVYAALLDDYEGRFTSMLVAGFRRTSVALMSRFALGRPDATRALRDWLGQAESDAIHAELIHTPGTRDGNVVLRPKLFDDVITLTGATGGTIGLDRLRIRLVGDRIMLRDSESGRPVIIELSSAHYISAVGAHPVYTFLGHLSGNGSAGWLWDPMGELSHLPRVVCGSVIVAPEQWRLTRAQVKRVIADKNLRALLPGIGARRWVGAGQDDQVLPIDLDSDRSIGAVLAHFASHEHTRLTELPQVESPGVAGPTGRHVAETIVPIITMRTERAVSTVAEFDPAAGGQWVYAKFFTGTSGADQVIAQAHQVATALRTAGLIDGWFFLRYREDGYHVRVRMRPVDAQRRAAVLVELDRLGQRLRAAGLVTRVATDEYVPEVARYGGPANLALAERLFSADSDAVAAHVASGSDEQTRLYLTVGTTLRRVRAAFATVAEQQEFLRNCQGGLDVHFEREGNPLGKFYREHRPALSAFLDEHTGETAADDLFGELSSRLDSGIQGPVLAAVLHMHCNRVFAVDSRRLEFLTYELTARKIREYQAREAS
ncbi:MAG TPA: thiopeptide-type bacteriocin biosynthesis protein [Pseudonocardiaceae bacterium]|jgi:thiopeptide-type bacteriocin biosynthesis protein